MKLKSAVVAFLVCLIGLFGLSFVYSGFVSKCVNSYNGYTIVIDAGHGGRDGGCVGVAGTIEKEINLAYAFALKDELTKYGYRVELTRKTDDGLYSIFATNKKQSDMKNRLAMIRKANPSLVISLHTDTFADRAVFGANTFYRKGDESSKTIADLIQGSLYNQKCAQNKTSKVGDYYILNSSYYTAVLIECGFISNPDEEKRLNTDDYRQTFIKAVVEGLILYFGTNNKI